jgi:hypothetical protein
VNDFLIIILIALAVATLAALFLKSRGYTFARSLITWFLAAAGILALVFKVIRDYF